MQFYHTWNAWSKCMCVGSWCLMVYSFLLQGEEEKGKENKPEDEEKEESSEVQCWCCCILTISSCRIVSAKHCHVHLFAYHTLRTCMLDWVHCHDELSLLGYFGKSFVHQPPAPPHHPNLSVHTIKTSCLEVRCVCVAVRHCEWLQ